MKELNINLTAANGNEIIFRTGDAPPAYEKQLVELTGNIFAPGEYVAKRPEEMQELQKKTHVIFDYTNRQIKLVVNEQEPDGKDITGTLQHTEEFLDFQINRAFSYSISKLYKMLRFKRAYFKNAELHQSLLNQLKSFEAKTEIEFKRTDDFKGSTALQKIQTCKTNLTYSFVLNIAIYKGTDPVSFPVEIEFEPNDGSIVCWLISEELAEMEIKMRDEIMKRELQNFQDFVIIQK